MQIQPYLFFEGRCEEAIDFYRRTLGADTVMLMRWKDCPEPAQPGMTPPSPEKIMHARIKIGETVVMLADGMCQTQVSYQGFALNINAANEAEAERVFNALADGGQIRMPLGKTFFSPAFGMVADKFGVGWMVYVEQH